MQYFQRLTDGMLVLPITHVLVRNAHWWNPVEGDMDGDEIALRVPGAGGDMLEARDGELFKLLPGAKDLAFDLMRGVRASRLGKVKMFKLAPGQRSTPDVEIPGYLEYYTRYHAMLQSLPGTTFNCGDEAVSMMTGETWWFDASVARGIINNSKDDRIHLQMDVHIDP